MRIIKYCCLFNILICFIPTLCLAQSLEDLVGSDYVVKNNNEKTNTFFSDLFKKYEVNLSGTVTLDYFNRYVWRGQYLDNDDVFQPGITLSAKGFTVGYWSSWDMETSDSLNSDESDYFVSYARTIGLVTLTGGNTWYSFPGTGASSKEVFVSLGLNTILSPVLSVYHDYEDGKDLGEGNGNYYSLGLSHTVDLYKRYGISMTLGTTIGYVDHQWINGRGYHFTPTIALNIPINKNMIVSPIIEYNWIEGDLKNSDTNNQRRHVFGGVHSVISF